MLIKKCSQVFESIKYTKKASLNIKQLKDLGIMDIPTSGEDPKLITLPIQMEIAKLTGWIMLLCLSEKDFVGKSWPFRKHLIAISSDIYENFMDSNLGSLWHFGFPLKVWIWRFSALRATGLKMKMTTAPTVGTGDRVKGEKRLCFHPVRKGHKCDASWWRQKVLFGWKLKSFNRLLNSAGNWNYEIIYWCCSSRKDAPVVVKCDTKKQQVKCCHGFNELCCGLSHF